MGIEFDGDIHKEEEQMLRDTFKSALFENVGIPLLRVLNINVTEKELYLAIKDNFEEAKLCKKCGYPMILRSGTYGEFYGCSQYAYGECENTEKITVNWF